MMSLQASFTPTFRPILDEALKEAYMLLCSLPICEGGEQYLTSSIPCNIDLINDVAPQVH